jgi:hypothetical protein
MNRKIFIIIICFLQVYFSFSQNNFYFKRINPDANEYPRSVAEIPNSSSFFMSAYFKDLNTNITVPKLYKFSNNQISDSLWLTNEDGQINDVKYVNNKLYAFGLLINDTTNKLDFSFWLLDTSLNVILNKKYSTVFYGPFYLFSTVTSHNDFVITITGRDSTNFLGIMYVIIDSLGNLKDTIKYFNYTGNDFGYNIIEMDDYYLSFVQSDYLGPIMGNAACIIKYDSLLNIIDIHAMPGATVYNMMTSVAKNKNEFYLCGKNVTHFSGWDDFKIGILFMDSLYNIQNSVYIGSDSDTVDYPATLKSIDFISYSSIFLCGVYNFQWNPYGTNPSWVEIYNLDSLLNIKWKKYIGGDIYYTVSGIKATNNKGCMVYGTFYNYNDSIQQNDIFIIKLDSSGNVLSSIPHNIQVYNNPIVYPNPGQNELFISIPENYSETLFELYNSTGMLCAQEKFKTEELSVVTTQLKQGIYFYRIIQNNKTVATGKWIKE